ncbi:MAG: cupin domain-containing protein [Hyphomonadaceae bacterium]
MMRVSQAPVLDDATRAALASGRAEPALGLFINTLMELRGISDREGEIIAGVVLEAEAPAAMSPNALDMAFAAIERGGKPKQPELAYPELAGLPAGLLDLVRESEAKRGWSHAGPGVRRLDLGADGPLKLEIIRLGAGQAVPWHTHKGRELTLCVHGEFSDTLATYGPGDFSITDGSIRHQPKAHPGAPAFALAVTDAGLKFEGVLGAIQRIFGH